MTAKSWGWKIKGIWLRLIKTPRQGPVMPYSVIFSRSLSFYAEKLQDNVERNNPLLERLKKKSHG